MLGAGTRIDRYEVHELLGKGGYGAVYRARHLLTEQWVALKVLEQGASDSEGYDRLVREARAVAALGNPHVVRVFDCGVAEGGQAFLAMELLQGRDLAELVAREGPFAIERSIDIALQILEGLAAAHDRGIVHRDMKPANVFVTPNGAGHDFVKVLDFGISKMRRPGAHPLTLPGMAMGTPGYMAPEQLENAREADPRADVYACAALLYELLARQRPYSANTLDQLIMQIRQGQARPILSLAPSLPPRLAAVVDRGLARDPDARWPSARAFAEALRSFAATVPMEVPSVTPRLSPRSGTPVSVTAQTVAAPSNPSGRPPSLRPAPSRTPIFIGLAGLAVVACGVVAAIALSSDPKPQAAIAKNEEQAPKKKKVIEPEDDDEPVVPKKEEKKKASGGTFSAGGVSIEEPTVVGELDGKEIRAVLKKALPAMKECRRAKKEVVLSQIHVSPGGKIPIAAAAPDNKGNEAAARCAAQRFKDAAPGWKPGDSGIIFFEVTLDPL
jgi:serine/threonine-protein kinase